jgi:outer membrane protein, multidrug efflux system
MRKLTLAVLGTVLAVTLPARLDARPRASLTPADSHVTLPTSTAESPAVAAPDNWSVLGDVELSRLIDDALARSTDARAAWARVQQADVGIHSARAARAPQGGVGLARSGGSTPGADFAAEMAVSWELDLAGRLSARQREARADAEAARADLAAVRHVVAARVAQTWFELDGARRALALRETHLTTQEEIVALTTSLVTEGMLTPGDVARSRAEAATATADVLAARDAVQALEARLAVLIGQPPGQWTAPASSSSTEPIVVTVAIPDVASVVASRPDVRRARAALAGRGAAAEAAAAARWPKLSLVGLLGFVAGDLGSLFGGGSDTRQYGATLQWNLFSLPALQADYRRADAGMDEALAHYDATVLQALEEIEVALHRHGTAVAQVRARVAAAADSQQAAQVAQARFEEGATSTLEPLIARRDAIATQLGAIQALVAQRVSVVNALRALAISPG